MSLPQIHDGPPALNVHGHGALPRAFNSHLSPLIIPISECVTHQFLFKKSKNSQTQSTSTVDNRLALEGDGNQVIKGNTVSGGLVVNTLADDVALGALDTAASLGSDALDTAESLTRTGADTVTQLASGALEGFQSLLDSNQRTASEAFSLVNSSASNSAASARQVADSQKEFLRAQTGQDTVVKIIGYGLATLAIGGIAYAVATSRKTK